MHIITGLIVAGLATKMKRDKSLAGLPRFKTGPIQVAHVLPGRIRFTVPSLRSVAPSQLPWLEEFRSLQGVESLELSNVSGSVVIRYRPEQVDPPLLFGALVRFLDLEEELDRAYAPILMREIRELGQSLNHAVYDSSGGILDLWTIAALGLAGMGLKKTMETGWATFPAGFTLLWWALHVMSRKHEGVL